MTGVFARMRPARFHIAASGLLWMVPAVHLLFWAVYALVARPLGDYNVETDFFGDYVPWSRLWMTGHPTPMNGFKGPVYYLVLGGIGRLFSILSPGGYPPTPGIEFAVGKMLSVLSSALILLLVGRIGSEMTSPRWGSRTSVILPVSSQIMVAVNPEFLHHSYRAGTDLFSVAIALAVLFVILRAVSRGGFFLAGLMGGLAYLTRYNNAVLPIAVAAIALRRGARPMAAALAGILLISLPWALFLWKQTGDPFYNRNALNTAFEVFAKDRVPLLTFMQARLPFDSFGDVLRLGPGAVLTALAWNVPAHFFYDVTRMVPWPAGVLCLAGWFAGLWIARPRNPWILAGAFWILAVLSMIPVGYNGRFALAVLPFLALGLNGLGAGAEVPWIRQALSALDRRSIRMAAIPSLVLILITAYGIGLVRSRGQADFYEPRELLALKSALKDNHTALDSKGRLAARKPHAWYWLGVQPGSLPDGTSWQEIAEKLRQNGVRYLCVGADAANQRPALLPLADPSPEPRNRPGLKRLGSGVHEERGVLRAAVLYEVLDVVPSPDPLLTPPPRHQIPPAGVDRTTYLRWTMGRFSLRNGLLGQARSFLKDACERRPRWVSAIEWAGDAYAFSGEDDRAEELYRQATEAEPDSARTWCRFAFARVLHDDTAGAEEALRRAASLFGPDASEDYARMGRLYFRQEECGAAVAPLLYAAMIDQRDWRSRECLGWISMRVSGDAAEAGRYFEESLAAAPEGVDREAIEGILQRLHSSPQGTRD